MESERHKPHDEARHEYFRELCALATSGALAPEERAELNAHVRECAECSGDLQRYRALAKIGMSSIGASVSPPSEAPQSDWSPEMAKKELFRRISQGSAAPKPVFTEPRHRALPPPPVWRRIPTSHPSWEAVAAALLLGVASVATYEIGQSHGAKQALLRTHADPASPAAVSAIGPAPARPLTAELPTQLQIEREKAVRLSAQLREKTAELLKSRAKDLSIEQEISLIQARVTQLTSEKAFLANEREDLAAQLQRSESLLQSAQEQLVKLREERRGVELQTASLEAQLTEATLHLRQAEEQSRQQQQFLASDRDVRELMGARDLYIADVFDIDRNGQAQKVFGRVFYTAGKSLIFYAFDLDQEPGVHDASTFQAWGRRGPQDKRPLNMGIFYLDNEAKRRWVLRLDDPKLLSQIDAVFVTLEPHGATHTPTGKHLLFASLRTPPNHP